VWTVVVAVDLAADPLLASSARQPSSSYQPTISRVQQPMIATRYVQRARRPRRSTCRAATAAAATCSPKLTELRFRRLGLSTDSALNDKGAGGDHDDFVIRSRGDSLNQFSSSRGDVVGLILALSSL
jgi:hypothetical protein